MKTRTQWPRKPVARTAAIRWTVVATPLGALLVAATERGLCFARFGTDAAALEAELASEFPCAPRERADVALRAAAEAMHGAASGQPWPADLRLDVPASRFRRRVYAALRAIPRGSTRSYGELASGLGMPGAARAVARACATNPLPLAIPCHRVVPKSGDVGGYLGGAWRKRALLAAEGALPDRELTSSGKTAAGRGSSLGVRRARVRRASASRALRAAPRTNDGRGTAR